MATNLLSVLPDDAKLRTLAKLCFDGSRLEESEHVQTADLGRIVKKLFADLEIESPTDEAVLQESNGKASFDFEEFVQIARNLLNKGSRDSETLKPKEELVEGIKTKESDRSTPLMPIIKFVRKKRPSRSQNHTPMRRPKDKAQVRHLPFPSYPVSLSNFYQEGKINEVWAEHESRYCPVHSERASLAEYNLVLRRFPDLQKSHVEYSPSKPKGPALKSRTRSPGYHMSTERQVSQQRTIVNSPGRDDYQGLKPFVPSNPAEARSKLIRVIHGFQGSPYEAKREVMDT